ncbi:sensor histidine kinase [Wenxinia marina]|uniref:histidine kinase n=3 Tax=Wenxinia TaxID=653686 RepID=A0A0D0PIP0_9RHOB|nr:PAS domain-containing protein [Wenxinia marina]KIQ71206.1 PAS domain S-box [Wenxinia marina DSM 24838]
MPWTLLQQTPEADTLDLYRAIIEGAPAMLWLGDDIGKCVFLNRRQREFWGVDIDDLARFDWGRTLHPDDRDALAEPFSRAMRDRTPMDVEARYRRADGVYRRLHTSAAPRFNEDGRFVGMVCVNIDVTEQRATESDLRAAKDALALATAASDLGWGTWNLSTGRTEWDARGRELMDLDEDERDGNDWFARVPREDREIITEAVARSGRDLRPFNVTFRLRRKTGTERRIHASGTTETTPDGTATRATGLVRDITEEWREKQFQRLIIRELNHRMKNLLGLVNALVSQTTTEGRSATEYRTALRGRLDALAASSRLSVDADADALDLHGLASSILAPIRADRPDAVAMEGGPLRLPIHNGRMIGLALHELATNAAKYGALSVPDGKVSLSWRTESRDGRDCLVLTWQEEGGPKVAAPGSRGFGTRLLEHVISEDPGASADLAFAESGLRYRLVLPLD